MHPSEARVAVTRSLAGTACWSVTALLSLALLLTPHPGRTAPAAKDFAVLGRWITDKSQPDMDYNVTAGPNGQIIVHVPAKAVGRPTGEAVTMVLVGTDQFATPKGGKVRASFKVTGPREAEFKMMINRPDAFNLTDQLLERP